MLPSARLGAMASGAAAPPFLCAHAALLRGGEARSLLADSQASSLWPRGRREVSSSWRLRWRAAKSWIAAEPAAVLGVLPGAARMLVQRSCEVGLPVRRARRCSASPGRRSQLLCSAAVVRTGLGVPPGLTGGSRSDAARWAFICAVLVAAWQQPAVRPRDDPAQRAHRRRGSWATILRWAPASLSSRKAAAASRGGRVVLRLHPVDEAEMVTALGQT